MNQPFKQSLNITQLSSEKCKSVSQVVKNNALSHFKASDTLAASGDQANAIAHLILGSEELIKSFFLTLQSAGFPMRSIVNYKKLFYTHAARHNVVKELYSAFWFFSQLEEWPKRNPKHSTFQHYFMQFKYLVDSVNNVLQNHGWWDRADKIKQNCFYVDYDETGILSPVDYDEINYLEAKKFTDKFRIELLEMLSEFEQASDADLNKLKQAFEEAHIYASISEAINRKPEKT